MDFNYYNGAPQDYQIFGIPSAPEHSQASRSFEGSPTNAFPQTFSPLDSQFQYDQTTFVPHSASPDRSFSLPGPADQSNALSAFVPPEVNGVPTEEWPRARSSSDEREPSGLSRSRRKEQNRAAQRAFRERKERHVKALELKLAALEKDYSSSQSDNERLKRELAKIATENEILRATTSPSHPLNANPYSIPSKFLEDEPVETGPMHFVPTDSHSFAESMKNPANNRSGHGLPKQPGKVSSPYRIDINPSTGERLLDASATWDLIQSHELFQRGLVDVGDVCERLKKLAQCNGHGPSFDEADIKRAIQESVAGGRDEL